MQFTYELVNAGHLTEEQKHDIRQALAIQAYICQQEFEQLLDKYHQINVLAEAQGEAFVSKIEIDAEDCYVDLDCSKVTT